MKILIDMNLSPDWAELFSKQGWAAAHWSTIGDQRAPDHVIMEWACANGYIVFTHDLDFGALLAVTRAKGPSVIQIRIQDILPGYLGHKMIGILKQYEGALETGALITVDESRSRVRILPFP
jgi:predicted nuclease of predicted toxin-antitoxin system